MSVFQKIAEKIKPRPTDVNGIDFDTSGTKILRMRKTGEDLSLTGIDILPPVDCSQKEMATSSLSIPAKLRASYAAISVSIPGTSLKLLTTPGAIDASFENKLARNLGLPEDTTDRLGYRVLQEGSGRSESRILAVGLPEPAASNCLRLFASGLPAPWRLGASAVETLTAFEAGPIATAEPRTIGLLDFYAKRCCFSIFHNKSLVLLRCFEFGMEDVFRKITTSLNVDMTTAASILSDEAFDISDLLHDILQPLLTQLVVSRDFIERRDNCSLQSISICGLFSDSDTAIEKMEQALNIPVSPWDPFDIPRLTIASPLPPEFDTRRWRFAAALGAAIATFEESP